MRRAKLPTTKDKRCNSCGAVLIHSYDWYNDLYLWKCQGCGAFRYEPGAKFETRFIGADKIQQ